MRLRSPEALVRDLWDAIADTIVRSPAAARTTASTAFAATEPTQVSDLADWLADTTDGLSAGARLGLRIEVLPAPVAAGPLSAWAEPEEDDAGMAAPEESPAPTFRLVLQLRSTADPSLIVDAAALWRQPETVLTRFGPQAETGELAAETGETLTEAVVIALRERLDREHARHAASMRTRLARLAADVAALPVADSRAPEEIIGYDAAGLPR